MASLEKSDTFVLYVCPPNISGDLHLGHAMMIAVDDTICRWQFLNGKEVSFFFGTDHGGLSTQSVVEKRILSSGQSRFDLGREKFLNEMWKWIGQYQNRITNQVRGLAASCDWDRHVMTLDPQYTNAVLTSFERLYRDKLIYQGNYVIHWCPTCQTSMSDLEVNWEENPTEVFHLHMQTEDGNLLTVLVEQLSMLLGCSALLVAEHHPEAGKFAKNPITGEWIPVMVEANLRNLGIKPESKQLAIMCTPAHNSKHLKFAEDNSLPIRSAYSAQGTTDKSDCASLDPMQIKKMIFEQIDQIELLPLPTSYCSRCNDLAISDLSQQWFLKMQPLVDRLMPYIESDQVVFHPHSAKKLTLQWLNTIQDWCISRQIWWGHRLPVWTCQSCKHVTVDATGADVCGSCGSKDIQQSTDVLDTWFSSAHWTMAYLGWPNHTAELDLKYPASLLETGRDTLFFWIIRMMLVSLYHLGNVPGYEIYLHGLVTDENGKKMSKSIGNVIDVEKVLDEFGPEVLRFGLLINCHAGRDVAINRQNFLQGSQTKDRLHMIVDAFQEKSIESVRNNFLPKMSALDRWAFQKTAELGLVTKESLNGYDFAKYVRAVNELVRELHEFYRPWLLAHSGNELSEQTLRNLLVSLYPLFPETTTTLWKELTEENMQFEVQCIPNDVADLEPFFSIIRSIRQLEGAFGESQLQGLCIIIPVDSILSNHITEIESFYPNLRFKLGHLSDADLVILTDVFDVLGLDGILQSEWHRLLPILEKSKKHLSKELATFRKRRSVQDFDGILEKLTFASSLLNSSRKTIQGQLT